MPFQNPCDVLCGTGDRSLSEGQGDGLTPGTNMETAAPESCGPSQGLSALQVDMPGMEIATGLDHTIVLGILPGSYAFDQEILIEVLLCARYCAKCWLTEGEQTQDMLPPRLKPTV